VAGQHHLSGVEVVSVSDGKRSYRRYTDEEKAAALADVALLGPGAVAAKYDVPLGTLKTWQREYEIVHDPSVKRGRIELLAITYLEANLQALTAQAYIASQPEYLDRQPAGELAILHGVMADKSLRLLEALTRHTPARAIDGD
jgi:transposase-like protein